MPGINRLSWCLIYLPISRVPACMRAYVCVCVCFVFLRVFFLRVFFFAFLFLRILFAVCAKRFVWWCIYLVLRRDRPAPRRHIAACGMEGLPQLQGSLLLCSFSFSFLEGLPYSFRGAYFFFFFFAVETRCGKRLLCALYFSRFCVVFSAVYCFPLVSCMV